MEISDFDTENQSTESKIVASLERISQAFRVLLWQESKEHTLSPIQIQVLIFLLHHDPGKRKVSHLASEFNMTKATISDSVKVLEQKELIYKEFETHDSRSQIIHLTSKGKEIAEQTSVFAKEIRIPVEEMNRDDKENLMLSLFNIIRHLNRANVITVQRMCTTCAYYQSENGNPFCKLINQNLEILDLKIDCPEHQPLIN